MKMFSISVRSLLILGLLAFSVFVVINKNVIVNIYQYSEYYQLGVLYGNQYSENESIVEGIESKKEDPSVALLHNVFA